MSDPEWLPALILLEDFGGDWDRYCEHLNAVFEGQFRSPLQFRGRRVSRRWHPPFRNMSRAFWHLVTENPKPSKYRPESERRHMPRPSRPKDEERLPDMRRCERVAWVRPLLEAANDGDRTRVWWNDHRGQDHWLIALPNFSFVIVLDDHDDYLTIATMYSVYKWNRVEFEREHDRWHEAQKKLKPPSP